MTALKPYPEYKDSGIEWLGWVPAHWTVQPISSIASVRTSNVDKKSYADEQDVRLCNYTDVYYNDVIRPDMSFMQATASDAQVASFTLLSGDTVITKDSETPNDIGLSAFVAEALQGVVCGYHLAVYRPRRIAHGAYIKRLFDSSYLKAMLEVSAQGVTRVGLPKAALRGFPVPVPPEDEAVRISSFLDHETFEIDAFIADQQELVRLLNERRRSIMDTVTAASSGPMVRLRYLFDQSRKCNNSALEVLSVYRDHGVIPKSSRTDNLNKTPEDVSRYLVVRPGYVVVNKMKAWQGSLAVSEYGGIVSPDYEVLKPSTDRLLGEYVHYLLRSPRLISEYALRSVGIRPSQWRLYWDQLGDIAIPVPSIHDQHEIAMHLTEAVAEIDAAIADARKAIELSKERRAALISAAVTGKIDVRDDSAAKGAA